MRAMGFSLNVITLGSLVLGVGMMVDNSINVLESCFRAKEKIGNGATSFRDAALEGTRIMIASILGGTATTCVADLEEALEELKDMRADWKPEKEPNMNEEIELIKKWVKEIKQGACHLSEWRVTTTL